MADPPIAFWLSSSLIAVVSTSALVLSIQRAHHHKTSTTEAGQDSPIKLDTRRDLTVPFSDSTRIPRITLETITLTILAIYNFITIVQTTNGQQDQIFGAFNAAFLLVAWLYASVLVLVARQYTFPSEWGWILNIHLFTIYLASFPSALLSFWNVLDSRATVSWLEALPSLLGVLFGLDLIYTTATIERGPPFLDENDRQVSRFNVTSIWGFLTFSWISPLIETANKNKGLVSEDIPSLIPEYRGSNLYYIFGSTRGRSLLYRIYRANRGGIIVQVGTVIFASLSYYVPAYLINRILTLIQDDIDGHRDEDIITKGVLLVLALGVVVIVVGLLLGQQWFWSSSYLQVRIKAMLNIEIYRKTLRRIDQAVASDDTKKDQDSEAKDTDKKDKDDKDVADVAANTGTIVNLMSTDSNRVSEFSVWWCSMFAAPTELSIGVFFLYQLLGKSCLLGLSILVLTLPVNHYNAKQFVKVQDKLMESRDKRVGLMNEVLQGIRQIKFFAWESNWEKRIMEARNIELSHLRMVFIIDIIFGLLWQGSPILVTVISFWYFTKIEGNELTAPVAFTAISVFNELRFALNILPETFTELLQALISLRRIQKYLDEPEIIPPLPTDQTSPIIIGFRDATVAWKPASESTTAALASQDGSDAGTHVESDSFVLKDLSAEFPANELSLICGSTGSGKTLLMLSLLGEATLLQGQVMCPRSAVTDSVSSEFTLDKDIPQEDWILERSVAYVSQTAWLQNASIRDNILFGLPLVEKRYKATLTACALDKDFTALEDGDLTEIGEKGITLSGGQKARVSLARAVYSRAKNVLMDDILSAVDAHTAKHLYEKCLLGPLMSGRTRILITHHVKLCLNGSSLVAHIQNGRIDVIGSPAELRQSGELAIVLEDEQEEDELEKDEIEEIIPEITAEDSSEPVVRNKPKALIEDETRASGTVKLRIYKIYMSAEGGVFFWTLLVIMILGSRALEITESWWIKQWAQSYDPFVLHQSFPTMFSYTPDSRSTFTAASTTILSAAESVYSASDNVDTFSSDNNQVDFYLSIYILITFSSIIFGTSRFAVAFYGTLKANKKLYERLLHRVLRAPLRFFDTTPVGRILNRFSKDFETIDSSVPNDMMYFWIQSLTVITIIITVSSVLPIFLLPITIVTIINFIYGAMFVQTSRELKRMDSVARSPIFSHFTETIVGVTTIRAFGATRQFLQEMIKLCDASSRPFFSVWTINRWVSIRYAILGGCVNILAGLIIIMSIGRMNAAMAGFCFSFVLAYTDQIFWGVRRYTNLEMSFNAVERIVEFTEMEEEPPAFTDMRPPTNWPTQGKVEVRDLEVRYAAELDPVLKGLNFSIKPNEKVGVVGRTGSGKSTLALSFFRFVEASKGSIVIDNVDIKYIGTEDLRGNLTIIPQDPTLFSGSIRSNMDPFDQFTDDMIFTALRRVHLLPSDSDDDSEVVGVNANVFKDLDTPVSEGGKNFSQGQRQLLCLARALLKRTKIVLMDEATASVDFKTDKAIQKTIATEFADSTIICIAHRLHTVIEYDRILVLDQGQISEFDSPLELITNPQTSFYKMCRNSGEFDSLVAAAKAKHQLVDVDN
ncbi:P-loop containing nucleoside triphosphate hydrolase protein [Phycomyces nitens]|nr:P-loop containing nucleoside triphosphate hydrolase protein [Phycomyces nitens]